MNTANNDDLQKHKQGFVEDIFKGNRLPPSSVFETLKTIEEADDKYRWYLCTEEKPAHWACEQKNIYACLDSYKNLNSTKSTTMIPVYKLSPPIFDNMIVKQEMRNMISVTVKRA